MARPASADEVRAPRHALWVGARASWLAFGYRFYDGPSGQAETTGQWLKDGVAPEIDLGARLARRYVPYVFWEHGFMARGRRFEGSDASLSTNFFGGGVRYLAGDVDGLSPVLDLAIGKRSLRASSGGATFTMSGVEFFRLGLGAELRLASHATGSALVSFATGELSETDGTVLFSRGDVKAPPYANGTRIALQRAYVAVTIGGAVHFDLF